jgi:hypothetical protein
VEAQTALEWTFARVLGHPLGHRQQTAGNVFVIVIELAVALVADDDEVVSMGEGDQFPPNPFRT